MKSWFVRKGMPRHWLLKKYTYVIKTFNTLFQGKLEFIFSNDVMYTDGWYVTKDMPILQQSGEKGCNPNC